MNSESNLKTYLDELVYLRDYCEKQSAKLDLYSDELNLLKKDLNSISKINLKNKELLLLELESNMDKQKQIQIKQDSNLSSFQNSINSLKDETENKELEITQLNETVGRLKQIIDEKNELVSKFEKDVGDLNNTVLNCNEKIRSLENECNLLNKNNNTQLTKIDSLNNEIADLNSQITSKNKLFAELTEKISLKNQEIDSLKSKVPVIDLNAVVADKEVVINDLSGENVRLNAVVADKDVVINDLSGENVRLNGVISQQGVELGDLKNELDSFESVVSQRDGCISDLNKQIDSLKNDNLEKDQVIGKINGKLQDANIQISSLKDEAALKEEIHNSKWSEFKNQIVGFKLELDTLKEHALQVKENEIELSSQIAASNQEISNKIAEINYLKNGSFLRGISSPFSYPLLIFKSRGKNISNNIKLYRKLKNSDYFDAGFYLNEYPDVSKSKWCKYFSPELHYACFGLAEGRRCNGHNKELEDN